MLSFARFINAACLLTASFTHAFPQPNPVGAYPPSQSTFVHLRIEGATDTIYEAPIYSGPRNITTPSGGTHPCTGTNLGANPIPFATCTTSLDAASKLANFPYDGTYSPEFEDYFITSIATSTQTSTQFFGLLLNYQFTPVGGCQQVVKKDDQVLWAYDAFNKVYFLKVTPNKVAVRKGATVPVTVTDGTSGVAVEGAVIGGVATDAGGQATLRFPNAGVFQYKAERSDSLRSNALYVAVA